MITILRALTLLFLALAILSKLNGDYVLAIFDMLTALFFLVMTIEGRINQKAD